MRQQAQWWCSSRTLSPSLGAPLLLPGAARFAVRYCPPHTHGRSSSSPAQPRTALATYTIYHIVVPPHHRAPPLVAVVAAGRSFLFLLSSLAHNDSRSQPSGQETRNKLHQWYYSHQCVLAACCTTRGSKSPLLLLEVCIAYVLLILVLRSRS